MSSAQEDESEVPEPTTAATAPTEAPNAAHVTEGAPPMSTPLTRDWCTNPGLNVRYAGRSAVGLVREHNEDNFVIANLTTGEQAPRETSRIESVGEGGMLFAVCDGMGGAAAGEVASQMAVDVLQEAMRRGGIPPERDVLARRLVAAVEEAGRRIFDAAQKERSRRGMGTTATAAVLVDKVLFLAEVGDSRAYLLRNGALKQLTKDQSLVNQLIEAGHLTEAEAEAFEHSNIILQALGTSETVQVDLTFVELRRNDRLMLCSDGLSGLVHSDTLRDTLAGIDDPAECSAALVKFAEAGGGHDNITVVVIDFDGDALESARETDAFGYLQYPLLPSGAVAGAFSDEEITEASKPPTRFSHDSLPPIDPMRGPGVDSNPWLWISAGLVALLVGAWLLAASGGSGNATADEASSDRTVAPAEPAAEEKPQQVAELRVPVRVFSDVQDAELLVNGEAHARLVNGEEHTMELPPGAYRFEAQSHGNIAAVEVVTVKQDVPLDVYLRLPTGANEPGAHPNAAAAESGNEKAAQEAQAAKPAGAKPEEKEPAAEPAAPAPAAAPAKEAAKPKLAVKPEAAPKPPAPAAEPKPAAPAPEKKPRSVATAARVKKDVSGEPKPPPSAAEQAPPPPAAAPKPASPIPDNPF
jgi:serine/threonine protein phosphatase PrpC